MDAVNGDIEVVEGINLVQTEAQQAGGRSLNDVDLPVDVEERESEIDSLLVDRVARFLGSHTLQFKVSKDSIQDMQRSLDEGKSQIENSLSLMMIESRATRKSIHNVSR
jgi:pantothenate kinase